MLQHLVFSYTFNLQHAQTLVKDLTDEQMVQLPSGLINHPAWTLGHLASASNSLAKTLGRESTFPAEWEEKFKTGGTPSANMSDYPSKDEILSELTKQHDRVTEAVGKADPATFAKEFPDESTRKHFPTVGDFTAYLMSAHEGTHIGQIAAWRRAMGLGSGAGV